MESSRSVRHDDSEVEVRRTRKKTRETRGETSSKAAEGNRGKKRRVTSTDSQHRRAAKGAPRHDFDNLEIELESHLKKPKVQKMAGNALNKLDCIAAYTEWENSYVENHSTVCGVPAARLVDKMNEWEKSELNEGGVPCMAKNHAWPEQPPLLSLAGLVHLAKKLAPKDLMETMMNNDYSIADGPPCLQGVEDDEYESEETSGGESEGERQWVRAAVESGGELSESDDIPLERYRGIE